MTEKEIESFFRKIESGQIEIYNEFSLQHELGIYLRELYPKYKIQFERQITDFGLKKKDYDKKEIDIVIFQDIEKPIMAIELKFPRQGQHPEQMFNACTDLAFLEQLKLAKFASGLFMMVVDDELFFRGRDNSNIYSYFRNGKPIMGKIEKPTGTDKWKISIENEYFVKWKHLKNKYSYWFTRI